jgi:hypothetical protein
MKKKMYFLLMALILAISGFTQTTVTLPYSQDFEDPSNVGEWTLTFSTDTLNKWYIGSFVGNPGNSLYISDSQGVSNNYTGRRNGADESFAYATITVHFDTASEFDLQYQLKVAGENCGANCGDYLSVYMIPSTSTVPSTGYPTGGVTLQAQLNNLPTWTEQTLVIPGSYSGTTQKIVFVWLADPFTEIQPGPAIDNISIISSDCAVPSNLVVSNVTSTDATITWNGATNGINYNLQYKAANDSNWTTVAVNGDTTYTITGLTANTTYNVGVQTNCSTGNTSAFIYGTLLTSTTVVSTFPYTQNFEDTTNVNEWAFTSDDSQGWFVGSATGNTNSDGSTPHSMYFSNDGGLTNSYTLAMVQQRIMLMQQ